MFSLAFQVYGATHFCYWGWNLLLREYAVSRVAPLSRLIPVFGIVSSMFIIGQRPSASDGVSIALILLALAVGVKKGRILLARQSGERRPLESQVPMREP